MAEITILKQVTDTGFKQRILTKLLETHGIVILKDKFGRKLPLKAVSIHDTKITCAAAVKMDLDFSYSENYTAHIALDHEKFMFEVAPTTKNGLVVLTIYRIFHLQRRQTMRYRVPQDASMKLVINSINSTPCTLECPVTDINSLGCSINLSTTMQLNTNDLIDATISTYGEEPVQLQGVIRNVRPQGNGNVAGIEFHHLMYAGEERLTAMVAALHSKVHLKAS